MFFEKTKTYFIVQINQKNHLGLRQTFLKLIIYFCVNSITLVDYIVHLNHINYVTSTRRYCP